MAAQFTVTLRNSRLTAVKTANDAGGAGTGKLKIYGSIAAPGITVSPTGLPAGATLLATLTGLTLAAASAGAIAISATTQNGAASGTPTFVRFTDSTDNTYLEADAGVGSGTANFTQAVSNGGAVSLTSGTLTEGNA